MEFRMHLRLKRLASLNALQIALTVDMTNLHRHVSHAAPKIIPLILRTFVRWSKSVSLEDAVAV